MPNTLSEYYKSIGQPLPSVAARKPIAEQYGIKNYTGTAEQNNILLSKLQAGQQPGALPPATPAPAPGTPAAPTGGVAPGANVKPAEVVGDLGNLRMALREALNEAGQSRAAKNLETLGGGGMNVTPGTMGAVVSMIKGSAKPAIEQTFSDIITGYTEEQKRKEQKRQSTLSMINTMIDNGVFVDTPEGTLLEWEKEADLPEGTMLAWRARLKILQKMDDEKAALEMQRLKKSIASAGSPGGGDNPGGPTNNFADIMQEAINQGASPAQAAREAAAVAEGMGLSVNLNMLNSWTTQASKLVKAPAPAPAPAPAKTTKQRPGPLTGTRPQTTQNGKPLPDYSKIGESMPDFGAFFSRLWGG